MLKGMLAKEPDDVFLNYALAMELQAEEKWEDAIRQFRVTLEKDGNYLPCFYQLGQTSEKLSRTEEALGFYKKGLELAKAQKNQKAINEINEAIWMLED